MANDGADPLVTFYRFIPRAPKPIRADASAGGVLSMRGFRFCEPLRTASQFGWYLFPPMDFQLLWDGHEVFWAYDKKRWSPLTRTHFPGFSKQFDEHAPDDCRGFAPPFLGAGPEPGHVMIWSGWAARTAPEWSLLVRSAPNLPRSSGFENYEGILESDEWFGPLFVTARLCRTGVPILVRRERPIFVRARDRLAHWIARLECPRVLKKSARLERRGSRASRPRDERAIVDAQRHDDAVVPRDQTRRVRPPHHERCERGVVAT